MTRDQRSGGNGSLRFWNWGRHKSFYFASSKSQAPQRIWVSDKKVEQTEQNVTWSTIVDRLSDFLYQYGVFNLGIYTSFLWFCG